MKLILKIFMIHEKENITKEFAFHSNIEVNLEGTDEDDIYIIMMDRILEKIERFINGDGNGGTGWAVFSSTGRRPASYCHGVGTSCVRPSVRPCVRP